MREEGSDPPLRRLGRLGCLRLLRLLGLRRRRGRRGGRGRLSRREEAVVGELRGQQAAAARISNRELRRSELLAFGIWEVVAFTSIETPRCETSCVRASHTGRLWGPSSKNRHLKPTKPLVQWLWLHSTISTATAGLFARSWPATSGPRKTPCSQRAETRRDSPVFASARPFPGPGPPECLCQKAPGAQKDPPRLTAPQVVSQLLQTDSLVAFSASEDPPFTSASIFDRTITPQPCVF